MITIFKYTVFYDKYFRDIQNIVWIEKYLQEKEFNNNNKINRKHFLANDNCYDVLFEKAKQYGISPFPGEDDANYAIGLLYAIRGNQAKSKEYFNKVKSVELLKTLVQDC